MTTAVPTTETPNLRRRLTRVWRRMSDSYAANQGKATLASATLATLVTYAIDPAVITSPTEVSALPAMAGMIAGTLPSKRSSVFFAASAVAILIFPPLVSHAYHNIEARKAELATQTATPTDKEICEKLANGKGAVQVGNAVVSCIPR